MADPGISIRKVAYTLIIIFISFYIIRLGKPIIAPLIYASLFSLLLTPMCNYFDKKIGNSIISILVTFLLAILPVSILITVFAWQFIEILKDLTLMRENFMDTITSLFTFLRNQLGLDISETRQWMGDNMPGVMSDPFGFALESIGTSTFVFTSTVLTVIFTFMLLLYRKAAKEFFKVQFSPKIREDARHTLKQIQDLTQSYLYGIIVVMIILAICNSAGLLLIGIDYAIFWGCLAAFLALIPYIGTLLGGLLPLIFAIVTTDTTWQPIAVIFLFSLIQTIEGNVITPKIVGKSVSINPLIAIIVLIIGGIVWGISGMILAIPVFGVLNTVMATLDPLKPLSLLFSNRIYRSHGEFLEKYDNDRYRLTSLFRKETDNRVQSKRSG